MEHLTHTNWVARPPIDFNGRELQRIRLSLNLSAEDVAKLTKLNRYQVTHAEEYDGINATKENARKSRTIQNVITKELHKYIMRKKAPVLLKIKEKQNGRFR